jgi:acyl dehydratase
MGEERKTIAAADLKAMTGKEIGVSKWIEITQAKIDAFADITEDWQYIHVDPQKAATTPFGTTIAHGFLTLSMLSIMSHSAVPRIEGAVMGVNYGFEKVRFVSPVPSGARVRGKFTLLSAEELKPGEITAKYQVEVEIEGSARPALVAEWIGRQYLGQ